ncbi:hypothetical protein [Phenylobacterium kunshanense]|uniref:hypothetical protein n=1 Tax=Phenylobacterium kunshanense TaxID=1445034 RepID=UPI00140205B2|nr:hypothetical protein [Phenylobacterium kunshanense]
MALPKQQSLAQDPVIEKLESGEYDRQLDLFRDTIEDCAAVLRRAYEAMKAENTLRS